MIDLDNLEEACQELKEGHAKYLLVNVISKRVRAYGRGDKPLVEASPTADLADLALAELRGDKLTLTREEPQKEEVVEQEEAAAEEEE